MPSLRILLVEDSTLTTQQLNELLHSLQDDIAISSVATEREAISVAMDWHPDIVVLDLRLRDGWGFNVLRKIAPMNPKPFIAVLTNYALPQYREYALLIGADAFLDKSVDMESLPKVLAEQVLNRKR